LNLIHLDDIVQTILRCDGDLQLASHYLVSDSRPVERTGNWLNLVSVGHAINYELGKASDTDGSGSATDRLHPHSIHVRSPTRK
ncbi:MAG: hypothetical protein RLO18_28645, partial [Gimesia chilikensis]